MPDSITAKKVKIGIFNDSFPPIYDGVATVVVNYAKYLNKNEIDAKVITLNHPDARDKYNFEVIRYFSLPLPVRKNYRLGCYLFDFNFRKNLKKIKFDIIHAHSPFSAGRLALKIAKKTGVPIIGSFHSKYYEDFLPVVRSKWLANLILKWIINFYNQCDEVWTVNEATLTTLKKYGYQKDNVFIIPNGVEYPEEIYPVEIIEKDLSLREDDFVMLYVGQHIIQKNIFLILQGLNILRSRNINFKMIFVGNGDTKRKMKRFVKENNLEERVVFVGTINDRNYLFTLYKRANIFLFPSMYDTFGLVVREAASMCCPSIMLKDTNASEGIIDNYNGFLIDNSPESLAMKIEELFFDRSKIKIVGENAKSSLVFKWPEIIKKVIERYESLLLRTRFVK